MTNLSPLAKIRADTKIELPHILKNISEIFAEPKYIVPTNKNIVEQLVKLFPKTIEQPVLHFTRSATNSNVLRPLRLGVVLSGGQAPGGHNVIAGIFDALEKIHSSSALFGFLNGPSGILTNEFIKITEELLSPYRNQGGFDLLGSGRTKISKPEQFALAKKNVEALQLDGLIIIGGDDSNTNAALLAEYFLAEGCTTKVVGVPKTIDGDLKNKEIEISFGFDSASKCYSEIIGNIAKDAVSAKKYYYFIRIMGRSASHLALECALQTHPNMTLISEEIAYLQLSLKEIVEQITDMISARASLGLHYGVVLIPEGIIEFIPEVKQLIAELNVLLVDTLFSQEKNENFSQQLAKLSEALSEHSNSVLSQLPESIQKQLLLERDPHGNVQVSKIETERLFASLVEQELEKRRLASSYFGKFAFQPHFCGYEGRSCLPSYFDSHYCYALGYVSALLVAHGYTGYMSGLKDLHAKVSDWIPIGVPILNMFTVEERKGRPQPVVAKALVELDQKPFLRFSSQRNQWLLEDHYLYSGPMQFFGPPEIVQSVTETLILENT